ncbi:MAG: hypothetical protein ACYST0_09870, partial [Planctomycetota bacterium]
MTDLTDKQRAAMENAIASLERSIAFWERMQDMDLAPAAAPAATPATAPAAPAAAPAAPAPTPAAAPAPAPAAVPAAAQPRAARARINVAALQAEIRARFLEFPPHKATGLVLKS